MSDPDEDRRAPRPDTPPSKTFMLELTEAELTVLWACITIVKAHPIKQVDRSDRRVDKAVNTVEGKIRALLEKP